MRYRAAHQRKRGFMTVIVVLGILSLLCGGVLYFMTVRNGVGDMYESKILELKEQIAFYEDKEMEVRRQGEDVRLKEYDCIEIASCINCGDFVDVRLMLADGSDSVVLAKKEVIELNQPKGTISLCVNESEIRLMDRAELEWGRNKGAQLYLVRYIDPMFQSASKTTFGIDQIGLLSLGSVVRKFAMFGREI